MLASTNEAGLTPLHIAVIRRHVAAVQALLVAGASVHVKDKEGRTALHHLAHSCEESILENFRQAGGGKFGEALEKLTAQGETITPATLFGLLREDLAEVEDPVALLKRFVSASTPAQMDAELKIAQALLDQGAAPNVLDKQRSTPLHWAAMSPRAGLVKLLIDRGAKIDLRDVGEMTPLHHAAMFGGRETLEELLNRGAHPDGKASLTGVSPLFMTVTRGDRDMTDSLLKHGADVNALGPDGETPLCRAAVLGTTELAKVLLDHGANVRARFSRLDHTALHVAAARGFVPIVELLLTRGADPGIADIKGYTPLLNAAEKSKLLVIRALLNGGANTNDANKLGRTALWLASAHGDTETVGYLLSHGADPKLIPDDGQSALHIAAFNNYPGPIRELLAARAPVEKNARLGTPLHCAAFGPGLHAIFASQRKPGQKYAEIGTAADSVTCARLLMEKGAPLDVLDGEGRTALQVAAQFGNSGVVTILLDRQRNAIKSADSHGMTLLHYTAKGPQLPSFSVVSLPRLPAEAFVGCGPTAQLLLDRGADLQARDEEGLTALHYAAATGNLPTLRALLDAKAKLAVSDKNGTTPLHWAAARGRKETAQALLAADAPVDPADKEGQTPLHLAVAAGQEVLVRLLLDHGANPNLRNHKGETAFTYAENHQRPEIGQMLRHGASPR